MRIRSLGHHGRHYDRVRQYPAGAVRDQLSRPPGHRLSRKPCSWVLSDVVPFSSRDNGTRRTRLDKGNRRRLSRPSNRLRLDFNRLLDQRRPLTTFVICIVLRYADAIARALCRLQMKHFAAQRAITTKEEWARHYRPEDARFYDEAFDYYWKKRTREWNSAIPKTTCH